jgi:hypothetical protein
VLPAINNDDALSAVQKARATDVAKEVASEHASIPESFGVAYESGGGGTDGAELIAAIGSLDAVKKFADGQSSLMDVVLSVAVAIKTTPMTQRNAPIAYAALAAVANRIGALLVWRAESRDFATEARNWYLARGTAEESLIRTMAAIYRRVVMAAARAAPLFSVQTFTTRVEGDDSLRTRTADGNKVYYIEEDLVAEQESARLSQEVKASVSRMLSISAGVGLDVAHALLVANERAGGAEKAFDEAAQIIVTGGGGGDSFEETLASTLKKQLGEAAAASMAINIRDSLRSTGGAGTLTLESAEMFGKILGGQKYKDHVEDQFLREYKE